MNLTAGRRGLRFSGLCGMGSSPVQNNYLCGIGTDNCSGSRCVCNVYMSCVFVNCTHDSGEHFTSKKEKN